MSIHKNKRFCSTTESTNDEKEKELERIAKDVSTYAIVTITKSY